MKFGKGRFVHRKARFIALRGVAQENGRTDGAVTMEPCYHTSTWSSRLFTIKFIRMRPERSNTVGERCKGAIKGYKM
jgi:hypothetical protein